ncbi:MAG: serpin family protein [Bacteroidales bacterium]|nr:serpin family protein [Bacteroidales bacterium]
MKQIFFAIAIFFALALTSCESLNNNSEGNENYEPIVLTKSQQAVAAKGDAFALDFLRACSQAFPGSNLFLSPMSASMLCSMLANGAEDETYAEIVKAIGMDNFTIDQVNDCYTTLVAALLKADRNVSLSLANSLWAAKELDLKSSFRKQMSRVYDAESYVVDFADDATLPRINGWCSDKTKGLIPKMFDEIDPQVQLILINALYFKGTWKVPFVKDLTTQATFYALSGQNTTADFMFAASGDAFTGYQDESVTVVRLPYGNGAFYLEAIMPADKDFMAFLAGLSSEKLARWDANNIQRFEVRFPKFKAAFDTEQQLIPIMQSLGMKKAFSRAAEFGKISNTPLYVSNMRQKAFVSLDEEGTEAAAVTIAELRKNEAGSGPVLAFNRPFVYLIREKSTGAILFAGTKLN